MSSTSSAGRAVAAEGVGTMMLLAAVVGSGIMGEQLSGGSVGLALLANTVATGAALLCLILALGPVSGAHFNPVVTLAAASQGGLPWGRVPLYVVAQVAGGLAGVALAHLMFAQPSLFAMSAHVRTGAAQMLSEAVATFGLVFVIFGCSRGAPAMTPFAVAAFITSAYWFTASTSFANPAVTIARSVTDTFSGIRPVDVPGFISGQLAGGLAATILCGWMLRPAAEKQ
jgi:glycerol uptake facilitator-like aquaporin